MAKGLIPLCVIMKPRIRLACSEVSPIEFDGAYIKETCVGSPGFSIDLERQEELSSGLPFRIRLLEF